MIAGLAVVGAACRSAREPHPPAVSKLHDDRICAATNTSKLPVLRSMGGGLIGGRYISDTLPPELESTIVNERVLDVLHGSTMTMTTTIADVRDPRPLPCSFTAVFADRTCSLEATGKRQATRTSTGGIGVPFGAWRWSLMVEIVDVASCTSGGRSPGNVVVEGIWNDLRLVEFDTGINYSGGDGTRGETRDFEGNDLTPEIKRWALDEQAAYLKGPGFEVRYTKDRDLYWYASSEPDGWAYRLRDGAGALLLDHEVFEGKSLPITQPGPIVQHGNSRYYFGASGALQLQDARAR